MPTAEEELAELRRENEKLKAQVSQKAGGREMSFKVSEKGAVSVYGLGRFPVTLYKEQWERLLGRADEIKKFIVDNNDRLKTKE
jgi:hypothetical protein